MLIDSIINTAAHPIKSEAFRISSKQQLDEQGALVLTDFLSENAVAKIVKEGIKKKPLAFFSSSDHNVYLREQDSDYPVQHARNLAVTSSKGCITDDQIAKDSLLRVLYDSDEFREFFSFCARRGEVIQLC